MLTVLNAYLQQFVRAVRQDLHCLMEQHQEYAQPVNHHAPLAKIHLLHA